MATGEVKDLRQAREIVRNSFEVKTYEPRETAKWEKAYECFRGL
jgi:hypothetical protein